jgi:hypothetical protein
MVRMMCYTANYSQPWTRMIAVGFPHVIRVLRSINPIFCVVSILLATSEHAFAQDFLGTIEQSCGYKKAYAVIIKLLGVYTSHVLTIKLEPGLDTLTTISRYVTAALLPSSTTLVALRDLVHRKAGFEQLGGEESPDLALCYRNMQKAINAGAVCFRIERNRVKSGWKVKKGHKVRGKPLKAGEVFIKVPRGTPAHLFVPTLVEGSSQLTKAVVGAIQLVLATLQLISVSDPQVAAYGYGSFIYTIIPYAIGSTINVACAIFTGGYFDITEMELVSETASLPLTQAQSADNEHNPQGPLFSPKTRVQNLPMALQSQKNQNTL